MVRPQKLCSSLLFPQALICALLVCGLVGCSGGNCSLSGTASYDGTPIEKGTIRLLPVGDIGVQGATADIVNGSFAIATNEELIDGEYTVMISATRPMTPEEIAAMPPPEEDEDEDDLEEGEEPQAPAEPMKQYIPPEYNFGSTLKITLEPGENTHNFELEKVVAKRWTGGDEEDDDPDD